MASLMLWNKKIAQTSEFIGIAILVFVLVLILMFNRISNEENKIDSTEKSISDSRNTWISNSVTKLPYITEKGISVSQLLGVFVCYEDTLAQNDFKVDYEGEIGEIDINDALRKVINNLYGKDNWMLEIDETYCLTSIDLSKSECVPNMDKYISYNFMYPLPCRKETRSAKIYIDTRGA